MLACCPTWWPEGIFSNHPVMDMYFIFYKRRYCFVASIATSHIDHSPASSVVRNVNCHSDCLRGLQESHPNLTFSAGCFCDCLRFFFIQTESFFLLISNLFAVVHKWLPTGQWKIAVGLTSSVRSLRESSWKHPPATWKLWNHPQVVF